MLLYLLKVPKAITFNVTSQIQGNSIKCLVDNHMTSFMVKQFNALLFLFPSLIPTQ